MTVKKLLILILGALILVGPAAGLVTAQEKKADDQKAAQTPPGKAVERSKSATGTVKAATADSLTVVGKGDKTWTFSVDTKTSIRKAGKSVIATDLKEGDPVHVRFTDAEGKLVAKAITVKAGGTAK